MSYIVSKGTTQTILLGYSNVFGNNTPQQSITGIYLNTSMKSATLHTPSDLSRNNSDTTSATSSLQAIKSVTHPFRKLNIKSSRNRHQQDNNTTITHDNLKTLDEN